MACDPFTPQVGTMGVEGYCVNVKCSHRGVGDDDCIFAFQHVVLPIGHYFLQLIFIIKEILEVCSEGLEAIFQLEINSSNKRMEWDSMFEFCKAKTTEKHPRGW